MKRCIYCGVIHEDDIEKCCEFSDFEPAESAEAKVECSDDKEKECDDKEDYEDQLPVQPAAHELLVELVDRIDLDEVNEHEEIVPIPDWINEIPYEEVQKIALAKWQDENPTLVQRIKKYLEI